MLLLLCWITWLVYIQFISIYYKYTLLWKGKLNENGKQNTRVEFPGIIYILYIVNLCICFLKGWVDFFFSLVYSVGQDAGVWVSLYIYNIIMSTCAKFSYIKICFSSGFYAYIYVENFCYLNNVDSRTLGWCGLIVIIIILCSRISPKQEWKGL